jgi:hypothetical protein
VAKKKEAPKKPTPKEDPFAAYGPTPEQLQAMLAGTVTQPAPIGGPETFFTPAYQEKMQGPTERMRPGFEPWRDGDEGLPGTWDRNSKARLQSLMLAAGLYGKGEVPAAGAWRASDAAAMRKVLEYANYEGIDDINEAVRGYAQISSQSPENATAARAPLTVKYANPEAVRQVVRQSSLNLLGRRLSDEEEAKLISGFQAQSVGAQRAEYAADATGGAATAPLSAESYAESQLGGTAEAGDQRYLSAFDKMVKTMTGTVVEGPRLSGKGGVV